MAYNILELSNKYEWNECIHRLPINQQDIYFTPEYYNLYEKNGDGKAHCFVFEKDGEIALYPFLSNSVNILGYELDKEYFDIQGTYGYNGVITSSYTNEFKKAFYDEFDSYCEKENIIAEFTRFHPIIRNVKFSEGFMETILDRKTLHLNLEFGYDQMWKGEYTSTNRNMIRKGRKLLYSMISQERKELTEFKKVYLHTMKEIEADNYYNFSEAYFKDLLSKNNYIINIFDNESDILQCSMILMISSIYAHYHLSGRSENCTNNSANNFMLDEAIRFAIKNGCKYFHLGGGSSNLPSDSLFKFKSNFSKDTLDFYIGKRIHNQKIYKEVIHQWSEKKPEKIDKYKNLLLKYRK